jgi:potassium-transporting ATPase KdpC subunit
MFANLRPAFGISLVFFILLGLAYPLAETGIGQALFSHQANGSLSADGSALVGQSWKGPRWFQGRPDADNPMATGGTNLGPSVEGTGPGGRAADHAAEEGGHHAHP